MTHITESPPANPPADGYEDSLVSTIYLPIVESVHTLMQNSGDFSFVSTYWSEPQFSISVAQYPTVMTVPNNFPMEPFAIGSQFIENQEWVTTYIYRHYKKVVLEEGFYFAEKFFDLIVANRHLIVPGGQCSVLKATPIRVEWDLETDGEYALNEVRCYWTAEVRRQ